MKTKALTILLLSLTSCAAPTSQQSQETMFNGVWNPQSAYMGASMGGARRVVTTERYYGAKDFFNQ